MPSDIQAWVRRLATGQPNGQPALAPSRVAVVHGRVSGIFRAAIRDRRIVASPCESTRLPKVTPKRIEPLATKAVRRWRRQPLRAGGRSSPRRQAQGYDRVSCSASQSTGSTSCGRCCASTGSSPRSPGQGLTLLVRTVPLPGVVVVALAAHLWPGSREPSGFRCDSGRAAASVSCHDLRPTTLRCSSATGSPSRQFRLGWDIHPPPRPWTAVATCGWTVTTGLARPSMPSSGLRGTLEGLRREVRPKTAGGSGVGGRAGR